jgi:hypothetical protein
MFRNMIRFDGGELLAPRPTSKLEDHPLLAVRDCLCSIFSSTLHIGGRSSIRNLRTCHAVLTVNHLSVKQVTVNLTSNKRIQLRYVKLLFVRVD